MIFIIILDRINSLRLFTKKRKRKAKGKEIQGKNRTLKSNVKYACKNNNSPIIAPIKPYFNQVFILFYNYCSPVSRE